MVKYLFYTTLKNCQARIDEINKILLPDVEGNVSKTYCLPEKHPEKELWALRIDESFVHLFTENELKIATEKTEDWTVKLEMI